MEWQYADRILYVNLTDKRVRVAPTTLELKRRFVGGAGFVAGLLMEGIRSGPRVVMAAGPLSDGLAGRLAMGAWPAPSGKVAVSNLGGKLAASVKNAGYDAVVIDGQLDRPAYLRIDATGACFADASHLWGSDTVKSEASLLAEHGRGHTSLVIGPAAENRVPFATLYHDGHHAGGTGVAAVLGSKLLKGLVIQDPGTVPSRCEGCTLVCPAKTGAQADEAGLLGLDAPMAARLAALAQRCADAGLLPPVEDPLDLIAHRTGPGEILADGEEAALSRLGAEAARLTEGLPRVKSRGTPQIPDLLGVCRRMWQEQPGRILREAVASTTSLITMKEGLPWPA